MSDDIIIYELGELPKGYDFSEVKNFFLAQSFGISSSEIEEIKVSGVLKHDADK